MNAALMTALGKALGCPARKGAAGAFKQRALPDRLYYRGRKLFVVPPPRPPRDETGFMTPTEREARELVREDRERLRRFFAGRYSARLKRVVRLGGQ
jgi:hypothetical protein